MRAKSVVMACGGFESNPEMRARYLGPNWDLAKVRGTRFNKGEGHRMAHRHRARPARPLVGLPMPCMGHERAALRRPHDRRPVPEAQLSVRHPRQRARAALRRRGRGLPQLHLRQVRPRGAASSPGCSPGRCSTRRSSACCAGIPHLAHHQGDRRHLRGARAQAHRRRREGVPANRARLQRRAAARRPVQSQHPRRTAHERARHRQDQLGPQARYAAVPRLSASRPASPSRSAA